jgi:hypothetical protein
MSRFVTRREREALPESPEALFRSLRPADPDLRHLWAHQADMLRAYQSSSMDSSDVALELPTGAGKTLVGLLLADFRRRTRAERVAYLCPTIQLARQVGARAEGYGIPVVVLTGPQRDWHQASYMSYARASSVAVSTYSAVFNTNPRLNDAQTLVLDDAHAAEGPVSAMWSIRAGRDDGELYRVLVEAILDVLPSAFAERLVEDDIDPVDRNRVELVGPHQLAPRAETLREALAVHATENNAFTRTVMSDAIGNCLLFVSWREILIRPLIAPTRTHRPFAGASQRIYMSATLGMGGELERAFGVPRISRLPVAPGWQEHGSGRRFFIFPGANLEPDEADALIAATIESAGRALVLAPSWYELEEAEPQILPIGTRKLSAGDLDHDGDPLAGSEPVAVMVANRYDGIDLPDEACRLIVLTGLPSGTHLQERFLYERLGARRVLAERIRTRIVQGSGRCTRNAKDFAAVIVRGDKLIDFISRSENTQPMQPELQAEIEFGLDNSEEQSADLGGMLGSFFQQDEDWQVADRDITARAVEKGQLPAQGAEQLERSVAMEVQAWQAAWRGDLTEATNRAGQAADQLDGDDVSAYRCLWMYLRASWATSAAASDAERTHAASLRDAAEACARSLSWRPALTTDRPHTPLTTEYGEREERATSLLLQFGLRGLRFERRMEALTRLLADRRAASFEDGLRGLGELLGFEAVRPAGSAQPDGAWRDGERCWFVFEAKTEEAADSPISPAEVRQALTHADWIRHELGWDEPEHAVTCLISEKSTIDKSAAAIARSLLVFPPDEFDLILRETIAAYRAVRARASGLEDQDVARAFAREFSDRGLDTESLLTRLSSHAVGQLRRAGGG